MSRATTFKKEYIDKIDEYLEKHQDEEKEILKQRNEDKGYEMYDKKLVVKLPTIKEFAIFIDVPYRTLYDWKKEGEEYLKNQNAEYEDFKRLELEQKADFSQALNKIFVEQEQRLLNKGLSGDYNSTIAKLILSSNHGYAEKQDVKTENKHTVSIKEVETKVKDILNFNE